MKTPYPMLWVNVEAEAAAEFYTSVFPNSQITAVARLNADVPGQSAGHVSTVAFTINGAKFVALNGGPEFTPNEAVSIVVECADQAEIDRYWDALTSDGGEESMCGWLKDRFGFSWQIVPENMGELLSTPAAVEAMLQMRRLDIAALKAAGEA